MRSRRRLERRRMRNGGKKKEWGTMRRQKLVNLIFLGIKVS